MTPCIECKTVMLPDSHPFTVCDDCWDKIHKPVKPSAEQQLAALRKVVRECADELNEYESQNAKRWADRLRAATDG